MLNPEHIRTAKDAGLQVRHDLMGWYVCTDEEGEHEDDGNNSVGFDGREHWADINEAWAAAAELAEIPMEERSGTQAAWLKAYSNGR